MPNETTTSEQNASRQRVKRALASGRPAVVQVIVDPQVNALQAPHIEEFISWYSGGGYGA